MGRGSKGASSATKESRTKLNKWIDKLSPKKDRTGFGKVPEGKNEFGQPIKGEFGERLPKDPTQTLAIEQSMRNIRNAGNAERKELIDRVSLLREQGDRQRAQDALDRAYITTESRLDFFRDQFRLYRGSAQERVIDQSIRSLVRTIKAIENLNR